jgi:hypothetical protein
LSEKKTVRRSVAIRLGIICVVVVAGLVGAFAYYHFTPNVTVTPLGLITSNPAAWVNRTVIVEGNFFLAGIHPPFVYYPWNYQLSGGQLDGIIGVSLSASVNMSALGKSFWNQWNQGFAVVRIHGVVKKGEILYVDVAEGTDTYYIEAETIEPLARAPF